MRKYFLFILAAMAVFLLPTASYAGTCNASYVDSLPQTSGSVGALPPDSPGQTPLGYITHIEATGGPSISFTYTPTVGSPVTSSINFGASSGVVCTSNQAGGFTTATKIYALYWQNYSGMYTQLVINNSTAPDHLLTCTGMEGNGSSGGNYFSTNDGLQKVWAGPGTEQLSWGGYNTVTGSIHQNSFDLNGSCRAGSSISSPSFSNPTATTNIYNQLILHVFGSGGITSVQYFVDNVSVGTTSTSPYDLLASTVSVGVHTMYAIVTFPLGTIKVGGGNIVYAPIKVSTGNTFACAITQGGNASCWGANTVGQLGANTSVSTSNVPLSVYGGSVSPSPGPSLAGITDISAGFADACAVNYGGVACWGLNDYGILGVLPATLASSNVPLQVIAQGSNVKNVVVGANHACALYTTGMVKCWGRGSYGQLGNGSFTATNITPTTVFASGIDQLQVALDTTYFRVGTDIWSFGRDNYGQLGNGGSATNSATPAQIIVGGATYLGSGYYGACALVSGTLKCWGANYAGECGNGVTSNPVTAPVVASVWSGFSMLGFTGGDETMCAGNAAGQIKCIGYNVFGQLGIGSTSSQELTPVIPSGWSAGMVTGSAGSENLCAFGNGHIQCAGDNVFHQIGDPGAANPQMTPYTVHGL